MAKLKTEWLKIVVTWLEQKIHIYRWVSLTASWFPGTLLILFVILNVLTSFIKHWPSNSPLMALTSCPMIFLFTSVTLPYTQTLFVCTQIEWHLSLPVMYCTAGTDRAREAEREERVERRSFCLSTPLRYTCHQPTPPPPPHCSLCRKWIKWDQTVCVSWCLGGQG